MGVRSAIVCGIWFTALGASAAQAAPLTIAVPANTADSAAVCTASPCPNLRSAVGLANANSGSTIALEAGSYTLELGQLTLKAAVTIEGSGPGATRIYQREEARVIEVPDTSAGPVRIEGAQITGGDVAPASDLIAIGGGIADFSPTWTLTLSNALIDHNHVRGGPGPAVSGSATAFPGGAGEGGGVFAAGPLEVLGTTVSANTADGGPGGEAAAAAGGAGGGASGAGVLAEGPLLVRDSTIAANVARAGTGGAADTLGGQGGFVLGAGLAKNGPGPATIRGSTFSQNRAGGGPGGAALSFGGNGGPTSFVGGGGLSLSTGTLVNSTVTGNEAQTGAPGAGEAPGSPGEILPPAGGGAFVFGSIAPAVFSSNTFSGNVSDASQMGSGGDIYVNAPAKPLELADTIVSSGSAAFGASCVGPIADGGHNLEETAPSQCGLGAGRANLIGANPQLLALAGNGGPTQTLALADTSPAIGAGGSCTDPASAGDPPLLVDQRGLPRAGPCDIGAYQHQPPAPGSPIPPPPLAAASAPPAPVITSVSEARSRWREGPAIASIAAHRRGRAPVGTTIRFTLNTTATVTLSFTQTLAGHVSGRRCAPGAPHGRRARRCRRTVTVATLSFPSVSAGAHAIAFAGRTGPGRHLALGRYGLALAATSSTGSTRASAPAFTIVAR